MRVPLVGRSTRPAILLVPICTSSQQELLKLRYPSPDVPEQTYPVAKP